MGLSGDRATGWEPHAVQDHDGLHEYSFGLDAS
jgi:hypothetical protein